MEGELCEKVRRLLAKDAESLSLDGARLSAFPAALGELLSEQKALKALSLANCRLRSLVGLGTLPALRHLNLSDNLLGDEALSALLRLESLSYLILSGNRLASAEALLALAPLARLKVLFVEGCPVAEAPGLRGRLFETFPALRHVDGFGRDGLEDSYLESDEGDSAENTDASADDFIDDEQAELAPPAGSPPTDTPAVGSAARVTTVAAVPTTSPAAESAREDLPSLSAEKPAKKVNQ